MAENGKTFLVPQNQGEAGYDNETFGGHLVKSKSDSGDVTNGHVPVTNGDHRVTNGTVVDKHDDRNYNHKNSEDVNLNTECIKDVKCSSDSKLPEYTDGKMLNSDEQRLSLPEDAVINMDTGRIRLTKSHNHHKEREDCEKIPLKDMSPGVPPMDNEKALEACAQEIRNGKGADDNGCHDLYITQKQGNGTGSGFEEYFVPVNTHKKFLRGEKLYLTKDSKKVCHRWRRVLICGLLWILIAIAVVVGVLIATGTLLPDTKHSPRHQVPSHTLPNRASIAGHHSSQYPPKVPHPKNVKTTTEHVPLAPTSQTTAVHGLTVPHEHASQSPATVPNAMVGEFSITDENFTEDLKDNSTEDFMSLSTHLEDELSRILKRNGVHFESLKILRFRSGSIIVTFLVMWKDKQHIAARKVENLMKFHLASNRNQLLAFQIDQYSLNFTDVTDECKLANGKCPYKCSWSYYTMKRTCICQGNMEYVPSDNTCQEKNAVPETIPTEIHTPAATSQATAIQQTVTAPSVLNHTSTTSNELQSTNDTTTAVPQTTSERTTTSAGAAETSASDTSKHQQTTTVGMVHDTTTSTTMSTIGESSATTAETSTEMTHTTSEQLSRGTSSLSESSSATSSETVSTILKQEPTTLAFPDGTTTAPVVDNLTTSVNAEVETTISVTMFVDNATSSTVDIPDTTVMIQTPSTSEYSSDPSVTKTPSVRSFDEVTPPMGSQDYGSSTESKLKAVQASTKSAPEVVTSNTTVEDITEYKDNIPDMSPSVNESVTNELVTVTPTDEVTDTVTETSEVVDNPLEGSVTDSYLNETVTESTTATFQSSGNFTNIEDESSNRTAGLVTSLNSTELPRTIESEMTETLDIDQEQTSSEIPEFSSVVTSDVPSNITEVTDDDISTPENTDVDVNVTETAGPDTESEVGQNVTESISIVTTMHTNDSTDSLYKLTMTSEEENDTSIYNSTITEDSSTTDNVTIYSNTSEATTLIDISNNGRNVTEVEGTVSPFDNFTYSEMNNSTEFDNVTTYDEMFNITGTNVTSEDADGNVTSDTYTFMPTFGMNDNLTTLQYAQMGNGSWNGTLLNATGVDCREDQFVCLATNKCLNNSFLCDGIEDCPGSADENDCAETCHTNFKCLNSSMCITSEALCDGIWDCPDGSDERNCTPTECAKHEVMCSDGSACIKPGSICDWKYNCRDRSDEASCVERTTCEKTMHFFCNDGLCIPWSLKCDGNYDCKDKEDEGNCTCLPDEFKCTDGKCLKSSSRCDGHQDCLTAEDEMGCVNVDDQGMVSTFEPYSGSWSLLCADDWTLDDGHYLCQELGFGHALATERQHVSFNGTWMAMKRENLTDSSLWTERVSFAEICSSNFAASVSCEKFECGNYSGLLHRRKRQVDDSLASPTNQWPFIAYISTFQSPMSCLSEILTPIWLITSAECVLSFGKEQNNGSDWYVRTNMGEMQLTDSQQNHEVKKIVLHPHSSKFRSLILRDYDIALIRLKHSLVFSDKIGAICLPEEQVPSGITCFSGVLGPERPRIPLPPSPTFSSSALMLLDKESCNVPEHYNEHINQRMLCTKNSEGQRICDKDGGAPLMCLSGPNKWYLAGMLTYQRFCSVYAWHPAVFSNLFSMKPFVDRVIGQKQYEVPYDSNVYVILPPTTVGPTTVTFPETTTPITSDLTTIVPALEYAITAHYDGMLHEYSTNITDMASNNATNSTEDIILVAHEGFNVSEERLDIGERNMSAEIDTGNNTKMISMTLKGNLSVNDASMDSLSEHGNYSLDIQVPTDNMTFPEMEDNVTTMNIVPTTESTVNITEGNVNTTTESTVNATESTVNMTEGTMNTTVSTGEDTVFLDDSKANVERMEETSAEIDEVMMMERSNDTESINPILKSANLAQNSARQNMEMSESETTEESGETTGKVPKSTDFETPSDEEQPTSTAENIDEYANASMSSSSLVDGGVRESSRNQSIAELVSTKSMDELADNTTDSSLHTSGMVIVTITSDNSQQTDAVPSKIEFTNKDRNKRKKQELTESSSTLTPDTEMLKKEFKDSKSKNMNSSRTDESPETSSISELTTQPTVEDSTPLDLSIGTRHPNDEPFTTDWQITTQKTTSEIVENDITTPMPNVDELEAKLKDKEFSCGDWPHDESYEQPMQSATHHEAFKRWPTIGLLRAGSGVCVSSVISPHYVVTSLQCLASKDKQLNAENWKFVHYNEKGHSVEKIVLYNLQKNKLIFMENDVALVRIKRDLLSNNTHLKPSCLPTSPAGNKSQCFSVSLELEQSENVSQKFNSAPVTVTPGSQCVFAKMYYEPIANSLMCIKYTSKDTVDPCKVDNGAPLLCYNSDKQWEIQGLSAPERKCSPKLPALYNSIYRARNWITDTILENDENY